MGCRADSPIQKNSVKENKQHVEEFFPFVKEFNVTRSWTGIMPFTHDNVPLIGKIGAVPGNGAYIISGLASGGMMQGPGAGQLLADLVTGCPKAKEMLSVADPDRFDWGRGGGSRLAKL